MATFDHVQPVIGPYSAQPAVCRPHDPRAAEVARQVASLIATWLPQAHAEHVGSTAVPKCPGKGIVDLMITVANCDKEQVKQLLDRLGFQRQTGPEAFPDDRPMLLGSFAHVGEEFQLHVHVIPADSPEVEQMRFFRACLRADPELLRAYVARKKQILASGVTDSLEYCRLKGEFIREVLG